MNELKNTLAPFQIGQAETCYELKKAEISLDDVEPKRPEWEICSTPLKWSNANWKWFLKVSGKITVHLQESIY